MTPPGSACSITIGIGITDAEPGSYRGTHLVVYDIEAAREELVARGVEVSDVRHFDREARRVAAGPDPEHGDVRVVRRLRRSRRQHLGAAGGPEGETRALTELPSMAARTASSRPEERHHDSRVAPDEHGARDRRRAEAVARPRRARRRARRDASRRSASSWTRSASSRFVSEMPTSVRPCAAISGIALARRPRAASRIVSV